MYGGASGVRLRRDYIVGTVGNLSSQQNRPPARWSGEERGEPSGNSGSCADQRRRALFSTFPAETEVQPAACVQCAWLRIFWLFDLEELDGGEHLDPDGPGRSSPAWRMKIKERTRFFLARDRTLRQIRSLVSENLFSVSADFIENGRANGAPCSPTRMIQTTIFGFFGASLPPPTCPLGGFAVCAMCDVGRRRPGRYLL